MQRYIFSLLKARFDKQKNIDSDKKKKKGPGRKRKYQMMKTEQIKAYTDKFFTDGLNKLSSNRYNTKRTDACVTMFQRTLK